MTVRKHDFIALFTVATVTVGMSVLFLFAQTAHAAADPIAHWRFDAGTGTAPADSSANAVTAAFRTPNPTWTTTVAPVSFTNPYALNFEGTGDGVQVTWPSGLNFSSNAARTFSFWYKPTMDGETASGNFDRILSWSGDGFEIAGTYGNVAVHRLAFYDGSWRDTGFDMTVGTWYNIAFTYDGTNVKLYVSGVEKFSGTSGGRALSGTMYIGTRHTGDEGINGLIDDFRVYDYALTPTQVDNIVAGSDNPDSAPAASSSSANGGGASMPVWLLNLRARNNLTFRGEAASSSTSSSSSSSVAAEIPAPIVAASSSSVSSSASSSSAPTRTPFQARTCKRVGKWFGGNFSMVDRLNERLRRWFGFTCEA